MVVQCTLQGGTTHLKGETTHGFLFCARMGSKQMGSLDGGHLDQMGGILDGGIFLDGEVAFFSNAPI